MAEFTTADSHFDHNNIIKWRPFDSVDEMHTVLIDNWNSIVGKRDVVYILGDFAFKNHVKWLSCLKGKKVLIRGNHDHMSVEAYNQFKAVYDVYELKYNKQKIFMSHYPHRSWNGSVHGRLHLYGHCHGRLPEDRIAFDTGVDCWDYKPVPIDTSIAKGKWLAKKFPIIQLPIPRVTADNSMWY